MKTNDGNKPFVTKKLFDYEEDDRPDDEPDFDGEIRYTLGKFSNATNPLVMIAMNPSGANKQECDRTIKKFLSIRKSLNDDRNEKYYDGWCVFNLYPQRATYPEQVIIDQDVLKDNFEIVFTIIDNKGISEVLIAWGDVSSKFNECKKRFLEKLKEKNITLFSFKNLTKGKNPAHLLNRRTAPRHVEYKETNKIYFIIIEKDNQLTLDQVEIA